MDVFALSRSWFDYCFENPEKIRPAHSALYFFCIEHCNRLGWKEKFGLPTTMAKEAIGIQNYRTYINTLNDLISFGFIKLIQKSTNQYSSNIIAIVKNTKASTKALDKALQKHSTKQSQSIDSIDIQETNNTIISKSWKNDFTTYRNECAENFDLLSKDEKFILMLERYNPGVHIQKSMENSFLCYWGTEAGWERKRKKKPVPEKINWKTTIQKTIGLNKVYKTKEEIANG